MLAVAFKEKLFLELNLGHGDPNQSEEGGRIEWQEARKRASDLRGVMEIVSSGSHSM